MLRSSFVKLFQQNMNLNPRNLKGVPIDLKLNNLQSCAKIFGKSMFFSFFRDIWTDLPPYPHINVENVISVLREMGSSK